MVYREACFESDSPTLGETCAQFEGKKILMGRDRLDTIKGIPQKLLAFEDFLGRFPEWQGKAVLFQVCLPPREERKTSKSQTSAEGELQELHAQINEYTPSPFLSRLVCSSTCNSSPDALSSSQTGWSYQRSLLDGRLHPHPLPQQQEPLARRDLRALHGRRRRHPHAPSRRHEPDVRTSLSSYQRYGEHCCLLYAPHSTAYHSCHEYVVCQKGNYGPLILSEFAGSAQSLGGAVLVNPWDIRGVASTIAEVFSMNETDKYAPFLRRSTSP